MAKGKFFKAILSRGASYTLPGVGVFMRGESKVVSEEQWQKLQGTGAFDFKELNEKDAPEETPEEKSSEEDKGTEGSSKPKPKGKGKK